jgi:MoaA/NifB/PqqE/SkfB family radical SAM enzyme
MYRYNEIQTVHLEMTDNCNAACPMCARNINGGEDNPQLPGTELSLADCKTIFDPDFIAQLKRMYMCGNYGDPVAARDTLEVFEYFRQNNNKMSLNMYTNGSAKKPDWWKQLAQVLGKNSYVVFSLDGLEDTNHLYRQNTIWSKIMENAQAFIDAGGIARWDYIVFAHNEHQVEEAEELSKKGAEIKNVKDLGPNSHVMRAKEYLLEKYGIVPDDTWSNVTGKQWDESQKAMKKLYESQKSDIYAVQDPSLIRSRFAAFDPKQANSPNILAGGLAVPIADEDTRKATLEKLFKEQK